MSPVVADIASSGDIRAVARYDSERLNRAVGMIGSPAPRFLGAGKLAFTVDQGVDTERYQGIAALEGSTLADCAQNYFRRSEQLETVISLVARVGDGEPWAAAAMLQRMPEEGGHAPLEQKDAEESDEGWRRVATLMASLTSAEMLNPELSPTDLLYRLFHEDGVRLYDPRRLRFACRCSRERLSAVLASSAPEDVADMAENGTITATCEFCGTDYVFEAAAFA